LKPNISLGVIQKTSNPDETLLISTEINDFSTLVNSKKGYTFKQAFPGITSERLQQVYYIEFSENEIVQEFNQRSEIENFIPLEIPALMFDLPNDYTEVSTIPGSSDYFCNTALEIINAPLAWTVTQGNPNIFVGIVDSKFDLNHPDLQNKVVINLDDVNENYAFHGTQVANFAAGDTNNGVGIASIGYNTRLVTADDYPKQAMRVWEVALIPGVKVINCSWAYSSYNSIQEHLYRYINDEIGVLVVAAAGNTNSSAYKYPASYPTVLSVAAVVTGMMWVK
jgi:subtilisin family serine protease